METRAPYLLIGLFTVVLTGGAMLFALWMAESGDQGRYQLYDVVFNEAVSGLSVGNRVEYSGIAVGEVRRLSLDPKDPRKVWARIQVQEDTPIKENTQARLALANVTGTSNIQLTNGTPNSPVLRGDDDKVPVIIAQPSPLAQLKLSSSEILISMNELMNQAKQLLSRENIAHVSQILNNINRFSGTLADQEPGLHQTLANLAATSRQSELLLTQANALLSKRGEPLLEDAGETVAALKRTSNQLEALVTDNAANVDLGLQGLSELGQTLRQLNQTLAAIEQVARQLENHPAEYLLGGEQIKEFQP
jgi:phospholipid/cholesterol/gamma-HCH transport system substrate-binding protein